MTTTNSDLTTTVISGNTQTIVTPSTASGETLNFYYSIWFYIDSWSIDNEKILFLRGTNDEPCPKVFLGKNENNLFVEMSYQSSISVDNTNSVSTNTFISPPVVNIPLQKWVNVIVSVYGRTLDIYLDGKLVRTSLLPRIPYINPNSTTITVCPSGYGFNGYTSLFQYYGVPATPQSSWNIYSKGYTGSSFGSITNAIGQYSIKLSLLNGQNETSSITI